MMRALCLACALAVGSIAAAPGARADNAMGYRLLSEADARSLPRNHGALGLEIEAAQRMNDAGMTFDLIRITKVHPNAPGAQAGFHPGDEIVAVDGNVFADLAAFAGYVGSLKPGQRITVDAIPSGGGPQQAERVNITVGSGAGGTQASSGGLSTRAKIGLGVAALLGCYELGCFSRSQPQPAQSQ